MSQIVDYKGHLELIKNHLNVNKAVLFVGAGFSRNAEPKYADIKNRFKTWTEFMEQLGSRLWPEIYLEDKDKFWEKINGNHLLVAQFFQEEFGVETFYNELLQAVPYKEFEPSQIHKDLLSLGWRDIITTNQDLLLEQTLEALHEQFDIVIDDLDIPIKNEYRKIYKMHGCMTRPSSVIFTEEQFRTYERLHPLMYVKLKAIFAEYTVAFVGFSLTDPNFKAIHGWVSDVLSKEYQRKAYAFVSDKEVDRYTQRYWEKRNVILLPIDMKSSADKTKAYVAGMTSYLEFLAPDGLDQKESKTRIKTFSQKYSDTDNFNFNFKQMKEDLGAFAGISLDSFERIEGQRVFQSVSGVINTLTGRDKYDILLAWANLLPPFFSIGETKLIDYLITTLGQHPDWDTRDQLFSFVQNKAELLMRIGEYTEAMTLIEDFLTQNNDISREYKNEYLWILIVKSKFDFDLLKVQSLIRELQVASDDCVWLNRLGNTYHLLGDDTLAREYFRRAQSIASERKDDWNLYVAYLSLQEVDSDLDTILDRSLTQEVHENIRNLQKKLESNHDARFKRLKSRETLKERLSVYELWKRDVKVAEAGAWNSETVNLFYDIYELIFFNQIYGLPDNLLNGQAYDWIGELFFEQEHFKDGLQFAIFFGHVRLLDRNLNIQNVSAYIENRDLLYGVANNVFRSLTEWLSTSGTQRHFNYIRMWLNGLAQLWLYLMPVMNDEGILYIEQCIKELFDKLCQIPRIDPQGLIRSKLFDVMGAIIFFHKEQIQDQILSKWIQETAKFIPVIRELKSLPWDSVEGQIEITEDTLHYFIGDDAYGLISQLLDQNLIDNKLKEAIFEEVYHIGTSHHVFNGKFYLLRYFGERLDEQQRSKIISQEITENIGKRTSHDLWYLDELGKMAPWIPVDIIDNLITDCERKIANEKKPYTLFLKREILTPYLILLEQLAKCELLPNLDKFFDVFQSNQGELTKGFWKSMDNFRELGRSSEMIRELKTGIIDIDLRRRQEYMYLTGAWLAGSHDLSHDEVMLCELVFAGFHDTNLEVSSESLRAAALFMERNYPWTEGYVQKIVERTEVLAARNHIPVLANLALLYCTIHGRIISDSALRERIKNVLKQMSNSPYSNVRKVIQRTKL